MRVLLALVVSLTLAGCGGNSQPSSPQPKAETPKRKTVFDPLVGTLDRAKGVQQTVNDQAAEQRRQIEEAEK
jgi:hypothetical protein